MKAKSCLTILMICAAIVVPSKAALFLSDYKGDDDALDKWNKIEAMIKDGMKRLTKNALPFVLKITREVNLTSSCLRDGLHLFNAIRRLDPRAVRFIDASGKVIDGLAIGTLSAVGLYDECLDTEIFSKSKEEQNKLLYRGQYCTLELKPPLPAKNNVFRLNAVVEGFENFTNHHNILSEFAKNAQMFYLLSIRIGLCVPSGCTQSDVNQVLNAIGNSIYIHANVTRCEVKEPNKYTPFKIVILFIFSVTAFLVFIATMLDFFSENDKEEEKSKMKQILLTFSFIKNYQKLLKIDTESENLRCLNGIRFIAMVWIVVTHSYILNNFQNVQGLLRIKDFAEDFAFQAIGNSFCITDTFFVIGGAVSCYVVMNYVKVKGHSFNVIMYIINRLLRILPVYIYLILFVFIVDLFGSGPFWQELAQGQIQNCYEKWWHNLLFINNFYDAENECANHTWYLACDFQFYILALVVLLPLIRMPKFGIAVGALLVISSATYCGVVTYIKDFPPTGLLNSPNFMKTREYFNNFYFRPYPHAGPYFIGLLLGYVLAMKPKLKIPAGFRLLGGILAFTFAFSTVYGAADWNRGREPTLAETIAYASLSKSAWALSIAWLILLCATGYGGLVNRFLSWHGFVPLGRLSFMAYLVHPVVIALYVSCLQTKVQAAHFVVVWLFCGHFCISFAVSFVASICIEAPFISLTKLLFLQNKRTKKDNASLSKPVYPIETLTIEFDGKDDFAKNYVNNSFSSQIQEMDAAHLKTCVENISNGNGTDRMSANEKSTDENRLKSNKTAPDDANTNGTNIVEDTLKPMGIEILANENNIEMELNEKNIKVGSEKMCSQETSMNKSQISTNHSIESDAAEIKRNGILSYNKKCSGTSSTVININENSINGTERIQDDPYDVKATFYPGLGWKLG